MSKATAVPLSGMQCAVVTFVFVASLIFVGQVKAQQYTGSDTRPVTIGEPRQVFRVTPQVASTPAPTAPIAAAAPGVPAPVATPIAPMAAAATSQYLVEVITTAPPPAAPKPAAAAPARKSAVVVPKGPAECVAGEEISIDGDPFVCADRQFSTKKAAPPIEKKPAECVKGRVVTIEGVEYECGARGFIAKPAPKPVTSGPAAGLTLTPKPPATAKKSP